MRFLLSVLDSATDTATGEEIVAIDAFNDRLRTGGHWVLAGGLSAPHDAVVVDGRGAAPSVTDGPYAETNEFIAGLWIIAAADRDEALRLAADGSRACRRRVEVRALAGGA